MTLVRLEPGPRGVGGWVGGGGGGVLRYFHTYVGSGHFLGFKILNFNIWGGGGGGGGVSEFFLLGGGGLYEDFVDIFVGLYNWTIFSGYFNAF